MAAAISCRILDISGTGARLSHLAEKPLPDEFVLHTGHMKHYAKVVWRKANEIGVEFEALTRPYLESGRLSGSEPTGT